jgi:hypothetical protein
LISLPTPCFINSKFKIQNCFSIALKRFHRRLPILTNTFPFKHLIKRHPENLHVKPERLMIHIPHIQLELLFPTDCIAPVNLCPTGNAGSDLVTAGLFRRIKWQILHQQGTWTNKTQIADCCQA